MKKAAMKGQFSAPLFNHKSITPLLPKSDLKILLCLTPEDLTQYDARQFYSSNRDPLGVKGLNEELCV